MNQPMQQQPLTRRPVNYSPPPQSDLDFNMRLTDNVWGSGAITPELKELLTKEYVMKDANGNVVVDDKGRPVLRRESLDAINSFYTRDIRLGNLQKGSNEFDYCVHSLNLAGDFLKEGFIKNFLIEMTRVLSILELSQSRSGFLRKEINTLRSEQKQELVEPPKKSLFGKPQQQ